MSDSQPPSITPFPASKIQGVQRFSGAREAADREREEQAFRHREAERDNQQRRTIVNVVGVFLLIVAIMSIGIGVFADNEGTREWAQGLVAVLIGGFVGFLTGRALK